MVVKSATKKKLMDLGVPEPAAHILSEDRKWDDVKQLQLVDLPFVLSNINPTSTELEAIHSIIQGTYQKPEVQKWSWWTPMAIQDLLHSVPGETWKNETLFNDIFIGAPLLHFGYVYRDGIDSEEPHKSPMFQLGIITNFSEETGQLNKRNGYTIEVKWIRSVIPSDFSYYTFSSLVPWIQTELNKGEIFSGNKLIWDPNPIPKEWKKSYPQWKQNKGGYGPQRLIHSKQFNEGESQLADVFVVLLNGHPEVKWDAKRLENPSTMKVFTQERQLQTGDPLTIPTDVRKMFEGFGQQYAFDDAIHEILPFLKHSQARFAINWRWFLEHIGV